MFVKPPAAVLAASTPRLGAGAVIIVLALLAPFVLYFDTARSIVRIWNSSDTFAHGYAILPISLWLVWRRRAQFAVTPPRPWWPGLLLLAGAGAAWLAATMGEVQVVRQYAFAAMLPLAALALFGPQLARALAFPLLFVLFAVPFGEVFVGPLIQFTADFTVAAVRASGIPVLRSGTRFELPTGVWSVVEACSGVRYLISSVTLGCLYAYLSYRSLWRRLAFVALAVAVPIVANGLRAYLIVMIGHTSDMALATGVDHLIYGWLFFGLVMFAMFWIGSYWREDDAPPAPQGAATAAPVPAARLATLAVALVAVCAVWPALAHWNAHANLRAQPARLAAPPVALPPAPAFTDWQAHYLPPSTRFTAAYRQDAGVVGLTILYYRNQTGERAAVSSLNSLAGPKDAWHETGAARRVVQAGAAPLALREATLERGGERLLVWHWLWSGGHHTDSIYAAKLWQARARLLLAGDDAAVLLLAAPYGDDPAAARRTLQRFVDEQFGALDTALLTTRGR